MSMMPDHESRCGVQCGIAVCPIFSAIFSGGAEGCIEEREFNGLSEDKLAFIRRVALL